MQAIFLISDLHLCPQQPQVENYFYEFIEKIFLPSSSTLYILGDLFEYWIGDDGGEKLGYTPEIELLTQLTRAGKTIYFMHGNRDFLVGSDFSEQTGVKILDDPTKLKLGNLNCLLKHGDDLCTDDVEHQQFRRLTRDPNWQNSVLSKTIEQRLEMAASLRQMSGSSYKPSDIMDVSESSVKEIFTNEDIDVLIHGHTHRPATHDYTINNQSKRRIVLGDWHNGISYLKVDDDGFNLVHS